MQGCERRQLGPPLEDFTRLTQELCMEHPSNPKPALLPLLMAQRTTVIMGNSGSGKSTLALALAAEGALAHLDLDTLAWEHTGPIRRRPLPESLQEISSFMQKHERWVIEGCYADLLALPLQSCAQLIFMNPGVEACIQNARSRPWEPHKYPSKEAQDANLEMLIGWIRDYETRQDEFSLTSHRRLFEGFGGHKHELRSNPTLSA